MNVDLQLLGSFELRIDGRRATLPARRDAGLLLKRLAVLRADEPAFTTFVDEVETFLAS